MCENCDKIRRDNWQEIRDLLNFKRPNNGPLSTQLKAWLEEYEAEHGELSNRDAAMDAIRAEMIAFRCALVTVYCQDTEFHRELPSKILNGWTHDVLRQEMLQFHGEPDMARILDMLIARAEEDDD